MGLFASAEERNIRRDVKEAIADLKTDLVEISFQPEIK